MRRAPQLRSRRRRRRREGATTGGWVGGVGMGGERGVGGTSTIAAVGMRRARAVVVLPLWFDRRGLLSDRTLVAELIW